MITWVTIWVLTITYNPWRDTATKEQFTYASEAICKRQGERAKTSSTTYSCNFQQLPVYVPNKSL